MEINNKKLQGKIALVTGSADGIGQAIARLLLKEGAITIIADVNEEKGEALAKELGDRAQFLQLDVSQEESWKKVTSEILIHYGRLDILVNNAGILGLNPNFGPQDAEHASLDSWRKVHAINADGVFLGCKYAIQMMKQHEYGSIVNMSSRSGMIGVPGAVAYASSKASVRNHTKSVALYCAEKGYNIRCNSVHPGAVLTSMWKSMLGEGTDNYQKNLQDVAKDIPLKRFAEPEEIAKAVLFLASDDSSYMTGSELIIDGGVLAGTITSPGQR